MARLAIAAEEENEVGVRKTKEEKSSDEAVDFGTSGFKNTRERAPENITTISTKI